jgi:ribosomal protein S18 acetylase RimI-like enzyme
MMGVIERNKYIYIADVLVHPKYRNERIATTMIYKMLEELDYDKGAQIIWLQVEEDNEKAKNLYKKLGMKPFFYYSYLKKYS